MDEYPKVIQARGVHVTVASAADEAHWRGQADTLRPDAVAMERAQYAQVEIATEAKEAKGKKPKDKRA